MCEIIKIGDSTAIICGCKPEHECDEKAQVYETPDGQRFFFSNSEEGDKWYNENYERVTMGSVACSICGGAAIDNAWKM